MSVSNISRRWAWPVLIAILAAAFALRSVGYWSVFLDDGTVVLASDDSSYHARLVQHGVDNFPRLLAFDALLNHPLGARVPWPPLYDWLLALVGWLLGGTGATVERMLAWVSPLLGSLAVLPIYVGARTLMSGALALTAAAIYGLLPITSLYARVGNADHHAWLVMLAACYLALSLRQNARAPGAATRPALGLVAVRVLVTTSWSGSLLYLVVGESALLVAALVRADRPALRLQAFGCGLAGALVAPVVALSPVPLGGWFSASALSWMQVMFFLGTSAVAGGLLWLESRWPSSGWVQRLGRALGLAICAGALMLLLPAVREGLAPALAYLSTRSGFAGNPEQFPLFAFLRSGVGRQLPGSTAYFAAFAYALPAPLLAAVWALRNPRLRSPALVLCVWTLALGPLAIAQLRWGNDFAPAAAIGFGLAFSLGFEATSARLPARRFAPGMARVVRAGLFACLSLLLLSAGLRHAPKFRAARVAMAADYEVELRVPTVQLVRFARKVREVTRGPDVDIDIDVDAMAGRGPVTGIMASPRYGHVLHYVAQRATPADNFGPQFSPERHADVLAFLATRRESRAVALARAHATRYVMTDRPAGRNRELVVVRLHASDGSAGSGGAALGHFRLIAEAEPRAVGLLGTRGADAPYKLFELVEGAELAVEATSGLLATARIRVRTPAGREFDWRTSARAGADGRARLRVPYASDSAAGAGGAGGIGPYRVSVAGTLQSVSVGEAEVRTGAVVSVPRAADAPAARSSASRASQSPPRRR